MVATSIMVVEAKRAAEHLAENAGIECEIIDLNCVSHIDIAPITASLARTGRLVVADTGWLAYGVAAEVCRLVCQTSPQLLRAPAVSLGLEAAPCPTAKNLENMFYPHLGKFVDAVAGLVRGRPDHGVALPDEESMTEVYRRFRGPF